MGTWVCPSPTPQGDASTVAGASQATSTLLSPSVVGDAGVSPSPLAPAASLPAASLSAAATISPAALSPGATCAAPATSGDANVTCTSAQAQWVAPSVSVQTGGNVEILASPAVATVSLGSVSLEASASASPSALALSSVSPGATCQGNASVECTPVHAQGALASATVQADGNVAAALSPAAATASLLGSVFPEASASVAPSASSQQATCPVVALSGSSQFTASPATASWQFLPAQVAASSGFSASPATGAATAPSPAAIAGSALAPYFTSYLSFFIPAPDIDAVGPEDETVNPPYGVATYAGPTSLNLAISETEGDPVRVYWRNLPFEVRDRVGPRLTGGDGNLLVEGLPVGGSILFNLVRETGLGRSRPYAFPATLIEADTLAGALGRKWDLVPSLSLACGPLFSQEAPATHLGRKLQLPWTIVCYDKTEYDFTFEDIYYETTRVDLTTYTLGAQAAENAADEVAARLDWQNLPFIDPVKTKVVKVEPLDFSISSTFTRHRSGQLVWHARTSYLVTLEKRDANRKPFLSFN